MNNRIEPGQPGYDILLSFYQASRELIYDHSYWMPLQDSGLVFIRKGSVGGFDQSYSHSSSPAASPPPLIKPKT